MASLVNENSSSSSPPVKIGAVKDPGYIGRLESRQQDDLFVHSNPNLTVMAVCDGHDSCNGKIASGVVKKSFYRDLVGNADIINSIRDDLVNAHVYLDDVFKNANERLKHAFIKLYQDKGYVVTEEKGYPVYHNGSMKRMIRGGTTASIVIILDNKFLITANVGDSSILLYGENVATITETVITSTFELEEVTDNYVIMSPGHSPDDISEYKRIKQYGEENGIEKPIKHLFDGVPVGVAEGKPCFVETENGLTKNNTGFYHKNVREEFACLIKDPESGTMLAMTRAIGDFSLQSKGMSYHPDVAVYNLTKIRETIPSARLMICSDGIWDCWIYEYIYTFFKTIRSQSEINQIDYNIDDDVQGNSAEMIRITERFMAKNKSEASKLFGSTADNMAIIICDL
jgi:serine/threonine protein phosphatase PrpC